MAFAITNKALTVDYQFIPTPATHIELADQTATTAAQNLGVACQTIKALIYVKSDTGTGALRFDLVADSASAMNATPTVIASYYNPAPFAFASQNSLVIELIGKTPLIAGYQYAEIVMTKTVGGDVVTFDAIIEGA